MKSHCDKKVGNIFRKTVLILACGAGSALMSGGALAQAPLSGAIFTTDASCSGVDLNIYQQKLDVFLNGGPARSGAAGLPDGLYYVKVTDPSGAQLLGTSGNQTPVTVINGNFVGCLRLASIVNAASDGQPGYDDTSNSGGEYKVWVGNEASFSNSATKTDNFKVKSSTAQPAKLNVVKFYDANANGVLDDGEPLITGWKIGIAACITAVRYTTVNMVVDPGTCVVTEQMPLQTNWLRTTANPVTVDIGAGQTKSVSFGNVCLGTGGGLTLGFWSNKNGQALLTTSDLASMAALNLRNASGTDFNPATYTDFRNWILGATATNMANMLSAQLATMKLNVLHAFVTGSALIYAPGATSATPQGFATVDAVMSEANTSLGTYGLTLSGPVRVYQEALKTALDSANNNFGFLQSTPCSFSFAY